MTARPTTLIDDARVLANATSIDDDMLARLAADDSRAAEIAIEMREADRGERPDAARAVWS